jgi:hypothetical protein
MVNWVLTLGRKIKAGGSLPPKRRKPHDKIHPLFQAC